MQAKRINHVFVLHFFYYMVENGDKTTKTILDHSHGMTS